MTKRLDSIRSSAIRKVFDKAASIKDVINLSIGQPDFLVPENTKKAMIEAIEENKTGYTPSAGIPILREKILSKYSGQKYAESVVITSGVSGAILLTYSALLEEGDEIVILDPYFVMYPDIAKFLGAVPIIVGANPDFSINLDNIKKAISAKTKAIMINSPNNPTGYVYSEEELRRVVEIAKKHDLWIISDEVYEDFDYEKRFISMGKLYDKTIVMSGYSKNLALTGLRVGYAVGPKEIIEDMIKLQQYTFVCAPSIVQYAIAKSMDSIDLVEQLKKFKNRRDLVYEGLKKNFNISKPQGAFYYLVPLPQEIGMDIFIDKCLERSLLVVPGYAFSEKGNYFRISYAVDEKNLEKGINILNEIVEELKGEQKNDR